MDIGYCVCWYFGLNETVAFTILWLQTNFGARNAVSISWKFEQSSRRGKNPSSVQFWFLPEPPEGVGWAGLVAPELWFELTKGFGGGMWESSWHVLKQVSHRVSRLDRFPLWLLFPTVVRLVRSQMATRWDVVPSDLFLRTTQGALKTFLFGLNDQELDKLM